MIIVRSVLSCGDRARWPAEDLVCDGRCSGVVKVCFDDFWRGGDGFDGME